MTVPKFSPAPLAVRAADGYIINGFEWRHSTLDDGRPLVIINAATSVACRYYFRFADFLFRNGFDVVTYDYRGIGASRPTSLRGFQASWVTWGDLDFQAVLRHATAERPGQPIDVVAHSVGGFVMGLAPLNHLIRRVFTVGAQIAYWRDFAPRSRLKMVTKWQFVMPFLTTLLGYFPGRALGWLEDTPRGVVRDWCTHMRRYEGLVRSGAASESIPERQALVERCSGVIAPILAVSVTDDEFGTIAAIERLLGYFRSSSAIHLRISPESIAQSEIGHFAFFHSRFENSLWKLPLDWLQTGCIAAGSPGVVISSGLRDGSPFLLAGQMKRPISA